MLGYAAAKASSVAWSASPSAGDDSQPDSLTVPVTAFGSQPVAPLDGLWASPVVESRERAATDTAVVNARDRRMGVLLGTPDQDGQAHHTLGTTGCLGRTRPMIGGRFQSRYDRGDPDRMRARQTATAAGEIERGGYHRR